MSKTSRKKLMDSVGHIVKHRSEAHRRMLREIQGAMDSFNRETGCCITAIDVDIADQEPKAYATKVQTRITYGRINLNDI